MTAIRALAGVLLAMVVVGGATSAAAAVCDAAALPPRPIPPVACTKPGTTTTVTTLTQLGTWIANPVTNLRIEGAIAFGGQGVSLVTECDVTTASTASLTGLGAFQIVADDVHLDGALTATSLTVRGAKTADIDGSAVVTAGDLLLEAPDVDIDGDEHFGTSYCALGSTRVVVRQSAQGYGTSDVVLKGGDVDLYGDFVNGGRPFNVRLEGTGNVVVRDASVIQARGRVHLIAGGSLDVYGEVTGSDLELFGDALTVRQSSRLQASGFINLIGEASTTVYGDLNAGRTVQMFGDVGYIAGAAEIRADSMRATIPGLLNQYGFVDADEIEWSLGEWYLRQSGAIQHSGDVSIEVAGRFDMRGKIQFNSHVEIDTGSYYLYGSHTFAPGSDCEISGTPLPGSASPVGCVAVP